MKRIIILLACVPLLAHAAAPSTTCPSGYVTINSPNITIATTCPSGYISIGTAESCLVESPSGNCIMYAPAGVDYTDDTGTYEFTDACPMS
ncbi:MAG: hypothetical protein J6L70_03040 [Alphaproteobacteria bacterium]|nr:hypothetical protein [Alphaproteobacteria bacterium]